MSSNTQVQTLQDTLRDRLRSTLLDIIPEEMFNELARSTTEQFLKADLPNLIRAELREHYLKEFKAHMETPEFQERYGYHNGMNGSYAPANVFRKILEENAAKIFSEAMAGIASQVTMNMRNNGLLR
jgi:hypothetical protein